MAIFYSQLVKIYLYCKIFLVQHLKKRKTSQNPKEFAWFCPFIQIWYSIQCPPKFPGSWHTRLWRSAGQLNVLVRLDIWQSLECVSHPLQLAWTITSPDYLSLPSPLSFQGINLSYHQAIDTFIVTIINHHAYDCRLRYLINPYPYPQCHFYYHVMTIVTRYPIPWLIIS